jgi:hypothetical protein
MDYPKFYNIKKTQPKHRENQIDIISTQLIVYLEKKIHMKLKVVNTKKNTYFKQENLKKRKRKKKVVKE